MSSRVIFDASQVELRSAGGSGNGNGPILDEGNYLVSVADMEVMEEERDDKKNFLQQQIMVEFQCGEGHFRQWYTVNHADTTFWKLDLGLRHMKQICVYSGCPDHKITDDRQSYTPILEGNEFAIGVRNLRDKATGAVRHKSLDNGKTVPMKVVQFIERSITNLPPVQKSASVAPGVEDILNKFSKTFKGSTLMTDEVPAGAPTGGTPTGTEEDVPF
jgi:hypothetical protein